MGSGEESSSRAAEKVKAETQELTTFYPATRKKKRKLVPDDFPKRPLSAYNFFVMESRQKILANREKNPDSSSDMNVVKHISSLWRNIAPIERARIERMAEADIVRYRDEVRVYEEKKGIHSARNIKTRMPEEDVTAANDRAGAAGPETF